MPRFDFRCTACGSVFEETIQFGSKSRPACPSCGAKKTEKLLSAPGIQFKGSGFYKTDSRKPETPVKEVSPKPETKKPGGDAPGSSSAA